MRKLEGLSRYLRRGAVVALACAGPLFVACGGGNGDEATRGGPTQTDGGVNELHDAEMVEIPTRWASANARDLSSLVQSSDEVFLGRVSRVIGQSESDLPAGVSSGRQPVPLTSFEVTVTSAQAGSLAPGATVVIEQAGGTIEVQGGGQAIVVLAGDELLEDGAAYLFFADRKSNGNLTVAPFGRLRVSGDGSLKPLERWSNMGALMELSGLSAPEAAARVRQAE